ncbi:MAG: chromosomal replication initiator protein DnaA [Acidibacillus sp.]|uniref:Chromosomal replication initiator protein DnaA n=1 Tax=Sulfoacidibacillus ferrooxidans TaxID=2005001 RepID=A0A9X2ABQ0_9BACL|nr:chromosomal replication initiator protein DnaA [Sulfoacidibacillus ferrooxidans]MCI0183278.1 Chromosomal replication initiator protein DnaA [Sulfoacidibacillus ferrooxidans]MCY0894044.1 chromosomal replication initiator protein DnaA [Acidibacillus sp.]
MINDGHLIWEQTVHVLHGTLEKSVFETWIHLTNAHSFDGHHLTIRVPSPMALDHINKFLLDTIHEALAVVTQLPITLSFILEEPNTNRIQQRKDYRDHPFEEEFTNQTPFNPKYTFDTFVIGERNRLAHAASIAVAERPAQNYNPFFLYGGVGLGKTHLMHAVGQHALRMNTNAKVVYISCETFVNEFVTALQTRTIDDFRNKYRRADILLIDDIQFIAGKESTQEEFFHTFNTLHNDHKQIVITSDRPPKDIERLEDRLRSRFSGGLIIDIKPPEFETRVAILRKKAKAEGFQIDNEALNLIATKVETNVRELEGALIRVIAYSSMMNRDIDLYLVEEALTDILPPDAKRPLTVMDVQRVVCTHFHIQLEDMLSRGRQREISYPRQLAMYLTRTLTDLSLPKIGREFGGRDHTTVLHACDKITTDLKADPKLQQTLHVLRDQLMATSHSG